MKIKMIIFDMDGTLLNTIEDLTNSVNYALSYYNLPLHTIEEVNSFVGDGVYKLIERAIPNGTDNPNFKNCLNLFKSHYKNNMQNKTKPYKGIIELLKSLKSKGIKTAVVSNKFDSAVKELSEKYFSGLINISAGENEAEGIKKKPAPDMVLKVIEAYDVDKNEVLYVGDSDTDILTAKNTGIDCISVSWGFRTKEFLIENGSTTIIDYPEQLLEYIK